MAAPSFYGRYTDAKDVVLNDAADTNKFDAIRNGDNAVGDIRVTIAGSGRDKTWHNLQPGEILPGKVTRIYALNTSVTFVEGLILE